MQQDDEAMTGISGVPSDEDVVRIGPGCSLDCVFCTHSRGRRGVPLDEALDPGFGVPVADRVQIIAGDVARPELAPLVGRLREAGARYVVVYAHPGGVPRKVLEVLKKAGLTGIDLLLPSAERKSLRLLTGGLGTVSRAAAVIDAAGDLGLSVAVEIPVVAANTAVLPDTVRRALRRIEHPDRIVIRFPVAWKDVIDPSAARAAVAEALDEARAARVPLRFGHGEDLPPCILDLPRATPDLYPGLGRPGIDGATESPYPACSECAVSQVCRTTPRKFHGFEPKPLRTRQDPGPGTSSAGLFLRQVELSGLLEEFKGRRGVLCRYPWEALEAHDIRGTVTPCAGGWPLPGAVNRCESWHGRSLLDAWNSPGMQAFRRAMASGRAGDTCKPDCPTFHGGASTALPTIAAPATARFFENLVLNLREMLAGAEVLRSRPLTLSISPTLRCMNHCRMCDVHEMRELFKDRTEIAEITDALYDELIDLLPTTRMLALTGGEPLVSRRVRDLLRAFRADEYPDGGVTLTTNGLLLRPSLLRDIRDTPVRLFYVSVNAATPRTYEFVTGTRGGFERVLSNVKGLLDDARHMAGRPRVALSFVVMRSNFEELPAFLDLARSLSTDVRLLPVERDRSGESIFTDEEVLQRVVDMLQDRVVPALRGFPWNTRVEVGRLLSILRGKLTRRDFTPL